MMVASLTVMLELLLCGEHPARHAVERAEDAFFCPISRADIARDGHAARSGPDLVHGQHSEEVLHEWVRLSAHRAAGLEARQRRLLLLLLLLFLFELLLLVRVCVRIGGIAVITGCGWQ